MKYVIRRVGDKRYSLEEIIYEDAEGQLYTDTVAYSRDKEYLEALAGAMNSNHKQQQVLYA